MRYQLSGSLNRDSLNLCAHASTQCRDGYNLFQHQYGWFLLHILQLFLPLCIGCNQRSRIPGGPSPLAVVLPDDSSCSRNPRSRNLRAGSAFRFHNRSRDRNRVLFKKYSNYTIIRLKNNREKEWERENERKVERKIG